MIDNEENKIKKENAGKGALLDTNMRTDDQSMISFNKELLKFLQNPNKEDKFMQYKINNAKRHDRYL